MLTLLLLLVSDIVTLKLRNYKKIIAERIKNNGSTLIVYVKVWDNKEYYSLPVESTQN